MLENIRWPRPSKDARILTRNNVFLAFFSGLFVLNLNPTWSADIRQYGAACDGQKNDAAAWKAAFEDAATRPNNEIISMSDGCWSYIGSTISVNVPVHALSGILGQGADLSRIIVGPGQNGFNFKIVPGGESDVHELLFAGVSIVRSDVTITSDNDAISVISTIGQSERALYDLVFTDISFSGIAKAYGWKNGAVIKDVNRIYFTDLRSYGSWTTTGLEVFAKDYMTQVVSIKGYWCEQADVCAALIGNIGDFSLTQFTFAAVNRGVTGFGVGGSEDSFQTSYKILPPGYVAAGVAGFEFRNIPSFDIEGIFFNALDYGANSHSIGVLTSGSHYAHLYGNNFYMTPNGSATCAIIADESLDVDIQGGTCDNAYNGFEIFPSARHTTIRHVIINDIKNEEILDKGIDSTISPNNINGIMR